MNIDDLLAQRKTTHGDFSVQGEAAQDLKERMRAYPGWERLTRVQREALDMIQHKISRILAGDPSAVDHWDDGSGYFKLVADRLRGNKI